ncbi:MAG: SUF system Fe-S cluster assembly regulator [Candidatus Sumerlaeia bacterium]|nr:SUF system Fe-S cluster assembly regulator [Candidatus Sumerlaeia bacterium]
MLRLTKQTDYALVLLSLMAREGRRPVFTARDLAERTHIPMPMVSKILKRLAREDLLESTRGVNGGYSLSREPEEMSAAEVILKLEGPITLTECAAASDSLCAIEGSCPVSSTLQRVNRVVIEALRGISLADMARPGPGAPPVFGPRRDAEAPARTPAGIGAAS